MVGAMDNSASGSERASTRHIVLLGASVGEAWNISEMPNRIKNTDYTFEYVGEYSADKSQQLASILDRGLEKPDVVIIKLCAAYFPGDPDKYKTFIENWIGDCREKGVIPVLATVVPVTKSYPLRIFMLSLLRWKWRYPRGNFEAIIEFNDWIRDYAHSEGLVVLDLEAALRTSQSDRHLNGRYAKADGLHINERAYAELDRIMMQTVKSIEFREGQGLEE